MLVALTGLFTLQSCQEKDGQILATYGAFTTPILIGPADGAFLEVAGTTVDLKWSSSDADGDPQKWDIYFGDTDDPGLVKANHTTQTYTVTIEKGVEYFWYVVGTDANGIPTTSATWSFEVVDPAAGLGMDMTWSTNALDAIGLDLEPVDVANLRLRILKSDRTTAAVTAINTTGFESFAGFNALADGKYYIATDLVTTIDAGDFNAPIDLSIDLAFSQRGVWEETFNFPTVMDNRFACSSYRVYLGYLVKTGDTYTFTKEVTKPTSVYSGVWLGVDIGDVEYDSEVETYMGCSLQISGLVNGWMSEFWGEEIVKGGSASITINPTTGVVTIANQYYCTTKYNGAVQTPYYIQGSGTYDATGTFPVMNIHYTLIQGTDDWGQWMFDNGYMTNNYFEADLTLDPAGLAVKKSAVQHNTKTLVKPVR